ncbi:MAG TPA: chromosome segregation protein SMC [Candidatus Nanopelagicaceae bacterium]|nr:chromosome segregation protein SMC [Candidatus Nanopelagicaceae bacterium]
MYLKSLTLRGFKSFASATTLRFEPGITCVVGPNGSGKSNVVDALAWVMGEQGAKTLRGGKMEDVIFAGTAAKAPLGRAEVSLTIDNSDGALPIEYAEVTITRTLFRSGASEYQINGESARLLDIQELLSDSGIGREMHVIVGQGQLDAILSATPEDRRGFIEEAAGVLKHRKRKEKALRKLDAMQANLTRIQDITVELRRQLKPLGKQAEVARKAATIQAELRDAKLRLYADDLINLRQSFEAEVADESALREKRAEVESALAEVHARENELDALAAADAPRLASAQETYYKLSSLRERFRGTASLAKERSRFLAEEADEARAAGRDPDAMEEDAKELRAIEAELRSKTEEERQLLVKAQSELKEVEVALKEEEANVARQVRAAADSREGRVRLAGEVNAVKSRIAAGEEEVARLTTAREAALNRANAAQNDFSGLEAQVAGLDQGEINLDSEYENAAAVLEKVQAKVESLREGERGADRERASWEARLEALKMGLARKDGTGVILAAAEQLNGVLGSIATLVSVEPGWESAVAAALGTAADAIAVSDTQSASDAIDYLKTNDGGRADILIGGGAGTAKNDENASEGRNTWPSLDGGARYALDVITATNALLPALERLLAKTVVVNNLAEARSLLNRHRDLVVATRDGDVISANFAKGGSEKTSSLIEVKAAIDEAAAKFADATHRGERLRFELAGAEQARLEAQSAVDVSLTRLHESDARMAALAEQMGLAGQGMKAAHAEAARLEQAIEQSVSTRASALERVAELEVRLAAAESEETQIEPDLTTVETLRADVSSKRQIEVDAKLALRTGEERADAAAQRAHQLELNAAAERQARVAAVARRDARARGAVVARAVLVLAQEALSALEVSVAQAAEERAHAEAERTEREGELLAIRLRGRELTTELEQLTSSVHRDEVSRAEQRLRIETLEGKLIEEMGVDVETLLREYSPDQEVPTWIENDRGDMVVGPSIAYRRDDQEKRLRAAEKSLTLLGKINPLALEEFSALEERSKFLSEQLEDLKNTRRDLLEIIREVDERVEIVFREAYADTAREFERVFARLFPGGEGRLVLTNPDDMLTTGIEVEARPPGKKIKRLSLLSGGERSLTAVALLIAIFKARPSPFYVMDEVEAALDDTNLGRLLNILEELRAESQLIIITHQKRTMEIGDALYGVTMRGDGVTEVVSQRLRETESTSA